MADRTPVHCTVTPSAPAGESQVGDFPFRKAVVAALERLPDLSPIQTGAGIVASVVLAPMAAWAWACGWVAHGLTYALVGVFALVPRGLYDGPVDPTVLAALILVVAMRLAALPFVYRSQRTAVRMELIRPAERDLQRKYLHDRERLAEETMKLYKRAGTNPFGGCLVLVPVVLLFGGLWGLLSGLTIRSADGTFSPDYISSGSALSEHMSQQQHFVSLGMDLTATWPELGWCQELWPYAAATGALCVLQVTTSWSTLQVVPYRPFVAIAALVPALWLPFFFIQLRLADCVVLAGQRRLIKWWRPKIAASVRNKAETVAAIGDIGQDWLTPPPKDQSDPSSWQGR